MADENKNTDKDTGDVEDIKKQMMEEIEESGDGDDTSQKLANENRRLKNTVSNLQTSISDLQDKLAKQEEDTQLKSGNFTGVLEQKDKQIAEVKAKLAEARLEVKKLTIGRRHGIPDKWCLAIPGQNEDEITANAVAMSADLPKKVGYADGEGDVKTFNRTDRPSPQQRKHHQIIDNAF